MADAFDLFYGVGIVSRWVAGRLYECVGGCSPEVRFV